MNFEKDYYINSEISNYNNYTHKKFNTLCEDLITTAKINKSNSILDFGCATGGLVSCFYNNEFKNIKGTDISYWAICYGREQFNLPVEVLNHYNRQLLEGDFDYILFLDVLEHIPTEELHKLFSLITKTKQLIVRIPVSKIEGENYVLDVSKNDKTHIQIHSKEWWNNFFEHQNFITKDILQTESIYESEGVLARVYRRTNES